MFGPKGRCHSQAALKESFMAFPVSKLAPTARAKCLHCGEKIEKGALKIEVERTVSTPKGERTAAASLHAACAAPWVAASGWPGGIEALAQAVSANGEVVVPELAAHLGADAALPLGKPERLFRLLDEDEPGHWLPPPRYTDELTDKIVALLEAHRWDAWDVERLTRYRIARLEVLRALVPKVPMHQRPELLGMLLAHLVPWCDQPEYAAVIDEMQAAPLQIRSQACFNLLGAQKSAETLVRDLFQRATGEDRVQALWLWADLAQRWAPAAPVLPSGLETLAVTFDGSESWSGRYPIHAAVWSGSVELSARFPDKALTAPIAQYRWYLGKDEKGSNKSILIEVPSGTTGAALAAEMVRVLREGHAWLSGEYRPKFSRRNLEDRPGLLEDALADRARLLPEVSKRLEIYEAVMAQLGGSVSPATASPARASTATPVAELPLPWVKDHVNDCADDVFDRNIDVRSAVARGDLVIVRYVVDDDEEGQSEICWPNPQPGDEKKLFELINAIADDLS